MPLPDTHFSVQNAFFYSKNTMFSFITLISFIAVLVVVFKIYSVITNTHCKSKMCLVGKTALVTGGNSGIGYQIVLALAQRGCRVIIADKTKDSNLLENVFKETNSRNVVFKRVDLSSFDSVRALAQDVYTNEEKLDILINNAGIANASEVTENGFDIVLQVNYLSAFLLTHLVIDLLKKAKGRVVFTSSILAHLHHLSLGILKPGALEIINSHYPNSKLCLIMAMDVFAEKLKKYGVTTNCYHPGFVDTNIFSTTHFEGSIVIRLGIKTMKYVALLIGKTAEEGAQTAIYLACAREVGKVTGEYFYEMKTTFKPKLARDQKICQEVWESTEDLVKLKPNEKL